jgi:hypothetical protein
MPREAYRLKLTPANAKLLAELRDLHRRFPKLVSEALGVEGDRMMDDARVQLARQSLMYHLSKVFAP